jgi:hypothetical protein
MASDALAHRFRRLRGNLIGGLEGQMMGWADEAAAGLPLPGGGSVPLPVGAPLRMLAGATDAGLSRTEVRDRVREYLRSERERAPASFVEGELVAQAPLMAIPGGQTALARLGTSAAVGGATGLVSGAGEAEELRDVPRTALTRGAEGAAAGGVLAGGGELASRGLQALGRGMQRGARGLADPIARARLEAAGLNPAPAPRTRYGRHLQRLGGAEEVAQMLDTERVGGRMLPTAEAVPEAVERLGRESGGQMDEIVRAMDEAAAASGGTRGTIPTHEYVGGVDEAARRLEGLRTGPAQRGAARLRADYIEPQVAQSGPMPRPLEEPRMGWQRAHDLRQQLDTESGVLSRAADPAEHSAAGGAAEARDALAALMNRSAEEADPALRGTWREANRRWSLRELLGENARGSATRLMPTMAEATAFAAGDPTSAMTARVASGAWSRYRPALQTRSLQGIAATLRTLGPRAERWSRTLDAAGRRGAVPLAAAHAILSRTDPEYRRAIEEIGEREEEQPTPAAVETTPEPESTSIDSLEGLSDEDLDALARELGGEMEQE